jgi:broad specificity phosphatase PhoE
VAAVTHAVMIRLFLAKLSRTDDENWRIPVRRGSVTELSGRSGTFMPVAPGPLGNGDAAGPPAPPHPTA